MVCYVMSAHALISLRMGLWTSNLLLFDASSKLIDEKRSAIIDAPTTFRDWLGQNNIAGGGADGGNCSSASLC